MNRKNLWRRIVSAAALFVLTVCAYAQNSITENSIVRTSLDNMFKNLDKTKVPTGLLLDYAVDIVDFDKYDGRELTDSNIVVLSTLEDILNSVNSASVTGRKPAGDVTSLSNGQSDSDVVPLYVALFRYNYIKANVLEDGLLNYDEATEQVSDAYRNGVWQNPYSENYIVAFAPSVEIKASLNVTYSLKESCFRTNIPEDVTIQFDAGDGGGYRSVNVSEEISVTYPESGIKDLKMRINVSGTILESHSKIFVAQAMSPMDADSLNYQCVKTAAYNGETVKGLMSCYFVDGKSITRPFIVVEGFDPWEQLEIMGKSNPIEMDVHLASTNHKKFHSDEFSRYDSYLKSLKSDFDLIYIDWDNSTSDIRANANLLIEFIKEVNKMKKEAGCEEPTILMGQSMGGLVARYALCKMENDGEKHGVGTFITHDTPHLGANVPLGALYFVQQALSFVHGYNKAIGVANLFSGGKLSKAERALYSILYSQSARQMLVNYVDPWLNLDNTIHKEWQQELNALGFPKYPQNLSIVNGRAFQQELAYDSHYLYAEGSVKTRFWTELLTPLFDTPLMAGLFSYMDLAALILPGSNKISFNAEVNPLSSSNNDRILSELTVKFTKKYLWFIPDTHKLFHDSRSIPFMTPYYDDMPGSTFELDDSDSTVIKKEGPDKNAFGKISYKLGYVNRFMFIPSASALCVGENGKLDESLAKTDFYTNPPTVSSSPFDSFYLCDSAYSHISLNGDILYWIRAQSELKMTGPQRAETGARYRVPGMYGMKWYTSDLTKASISSSGELHVTGSGSVEIVAEKYEDGKMYRVRKHVIVDFPDMLLDCEYRAGEGYVSTVRALNVSDMEFIEELVASGSLQYEWNVIDGNGNLRTLTNGSNKYAFIPDEKGVSTISVRLVEGENKGKLYSITIDDESIFKLAHPYVIVNSEGTVFLAKNGGNSKMTVDDKFAVKFNSMPSVAETQMPQIIEKMRTGGCRMVSRKKATLGIMIDEHGSYNTEKDIWEFDFFNSIEFLNDLKAAKTSKYDEIIGEYSISLDDHTGRNRLQNMTFTVFSKPDFMVVKPLPRPDPYPDIPIIRPFE